MPGQANQGPVPSAQENVPLPQAQTRLCGLCTCCFRPTKKVAPILGAASDYDLVEVRPGRYLRILHINRRLRDHAFKMEMEKYIDLHMRTGKYGCYDAKAWKLSRTRFGMGEEDEVTHGNKGYINHGAEIQNDNVSSVLPQNGHAITMANFHNKRHRHDSHQSDYSYKSVVSQNLPHHDDTVTDLRLDLAQDLGTEDSDGELSANHTRNSEGTCNSAESEGKSLGQMSPTAISGAYCQSLTLTTSEARITTATSVHFNLHQEEHNSDGYSEEKAQGVAQAELTSDPVKENTVMFFIHGVGGSSAVWQAQIDHFKKEGYELIVPDLIGHGNSCAPHNSSAYTFEEIAFDLLVVFDLYCKRRNAVIAHSYGSSFAALLGRRRIRRIQHLILISGGSPTPLAPQPGTFSAPTWFLRCCKPMVNRGFRKSAFHRKKSHALMEKAFDVPTYVLKYTMNGQNWMEGGEEYHRWLETGTLLIYGRQDKLVTLEEEQEMEKVIFGSVLEVVEAASHMVMMEQPEVVNNLIHRFLIGKLRRPASPAPVSPIMERSITGSRGSIRSYKAVPSGLIAGNLH